ncbi:hypothetical protein E2C01_031562 [Portunus trituberculatus]|uniref:Uncharacterized protein n=1 Tax=Portunus trituberculatus TaxID=210409 RepID=A0A5B7ETT2_PORTR|nr:hypothetical protein [Portunus trituberculatus]
MNVIQRTVAAQLLERRGRDQAAIVYNHWPLLVAMRGDVFQASQHSGKGIPAFIHSTTYLLPSELIYKTVLPGSHEQQKLARATCFGELLVHFGVEDTPVCVAAGATADIRVDEQDFSVLNSVLSHEPNVK